MVPNGEALQFTSPQRGLVHQALNEAEARTSRYYCIPPFRWEQLRYDLLTQADHGWEPLPDAKLARVRRFQRITPKPIDFFRIELSDGGILEVAHRENLIQDIYPFFVCILTHEMVHMIRLSSILDEQTDATILDAENEEQRVQHVSSRILAGSSIYEQILRKLNNPATISAQLPS
jgi:hypothetical protein